MIGELWVMKLLDTQKSKKALIWKIVFRLLVPLLAVCKDKHLYQIKSLFKECSICQIIKLIGSYFPIHCLNFKEVCIILVSWKIFKDAILWNYSWNLSCWILLIWDYKTLTAKMEFPSWRRLITNRLKKQESIRGCWKF